MMTTAAGLSVSTTDMKSSGTAMNSKFVWDDHLQMGKSLAPPIEYGSGYWEYYRELDNTEMAKHLTRARVDMVRKHWDGQVVDVGIGGGRFVTEMDCMGFDVCPDAIKWLIQGRRFSTPSVEAVTCWDSLEHMKDPVGFVSGITKWVFVSMPIYENKKHCLNSKHYKPGEHIWYWTHDGLVRWFRRCGFELIEYNDMESQIGREGILSYAFKRI